MTELIGRTLGQYRIVDKIGQGGMATVYKAYQPGLDRYVALKVLPPIHAGKPGFGQRFVREAKAIANLNHPNILPVHDFGQEGELSFIAMRYVEGARTLKVVMKSPLSLFQAADLIGQVATALDYAHRQGVIHRDVKPGNVLIDGDWALLTDFGLAKMTEASVELTGTGVGIGTPAYMSPEQGQGKAVDHRTDIYSLGIILFEILTGHIPHNAETPVAIIFKRATEPLPLPRSFNPAIPEAVERTILKALAREPDDRFASAGALAAALKEAVKRVDVEASGAPSLPQVGWRPPTQAPTPGAPLPPQLQILPPPEPTHPPEIGEFVGRRAELSYFARKLAEEGLAIISGMAGVGKTALAAALAEVWQVWEMSPPLNEAGERDERVADTVLRREAEAERQVFWHSFHEGEGVMGLIWKLAGFLAWQGQGDLWRMLATARQTGGQPPPPASLFDYVLQMIGRGGYLLCLDDVQWVEDDPLLVQFVERLETLIRAEEVSLILTSRHVPDYLRWASFEPLGGLSAADTGRLATARGLSLPKDLVEELYSRTEGNPQLLTLAINVLNRAGSPARIIGRLTEADDIERYLITEVDEGLSEDDRVVLIAVAVLLGYPGSRYAIETVSERRRLKRPLRQLCDRHLLTAEEREAEELYGEHAILRAFYYDLPGRRELRAKHRLAGEYYEDEEPDPLKAALHYERAGEYEKAARLATSDVWALINQGYARPLCGWLERLSSRELEPETGVAVHIACGQVHAFVGQSGPARESFQVALEQLAGLPGSPAVRRGQARACLGMGESLRHESPPEALSWLERGLVGLTGADDPAAHRQEEAALRIRAGNVQWSMGNYAAALDSLERGLALLPGDPSQWRAIALLNLGNVYDVQGDTQRANEHWQRALEISQELHDYFWMLVIWNNIGIGTYIAGDWPEAEASFEQALALAVQLGSVIEQARIGNSLGMVYDKRGDEESALTYLSHSLQLARNHNLRRNLPYVLNSLAALHICTEGWKAAEDSLHEAEQLALEQDAKFPLVDTYRFWAQVQLTRKQIEAALDYAEQSLCLARDLGLDREEGIGQRVLGRILLAGDQIEPALAAFEGSLALLTGRDPYEAARTQAAWGRYLASGPDLERGTALLEEAWATFERLGAMRDLAEVEEALGR